MCWHPLTSIRCESTNFTNFTNSPGSRSLGLGSWGLTWCLWMGRDDRPRLNIYQIQRKTYEANTFWLKKYGILTCNTMRTSDKDNFTTCKPYYAKLRLGFQVWTFMVQAPHLKSTSPHGRCMDIMRANVGSTSQVSNAAIEVTIKGLNHGDGPCCWSCLILRICLC